MLLTVRAFVTLEGGTTPNTGRCGSMELRSCPGVIDPVEEVHRAGAERQG